MSLTKKQLTDVCMLHGNNMCRYLQQEDDDLSKWNCLKHRKIEKKKIDERIISFCEDAKQHGIDPYSQGVPLGDNCGGFPLLKNIEQGIV
jgi:hypothetical protein